VASVQRSAASVLKSVRVSARTTARCSSAQTSAAGVWNLACTWLVQWSKAHEAYVTRQIGLARDLHIRACLSIPNIKKYLPPWLCLGKAYICIGGYRRRGATGVLLDIMPVSRLLILREIHSC